MPIDTPIKSSCAAVKKPAAEKIDKSAGACAAGASRNATATVSTALTRTGTVAALMTGADATKPPMRITGHHRRLTHEEISAASTTRGCMRMPPVTR